MRQGQPSTIDAGVIYTSIATIRFVAAGNRA
jgi:hypothetical protein